MEILYLEEFLELAKVLNYGKAADNLFISSSSLFKHIKSIENELGIPLFKRSGKNILLNDYGQIFLKYAERIVKENSMLQVDLSRQMQYDKKLIHIASDYKIFDAAVGFRKAHPAYSLNIDNHVLIPNADTLKERLDSGLFDMAFVHEYPDEGLYSPELFDKTKVLSDRMVLIVYEGHPLFFREEVNISELESEDFVMPYIQHQNLSDPGSRIFKDAGFSPQIVLSSESGSEVLDMVSKKLGITILSESIVGESHTRGIGMIRLNPDPVFNIYVVTSKIRPLSEGARLFKEAALEYFSKPVPSEE